MKSSEVKYTALENFSLLRNLKQAVIALYGSKRYRIYCVALFFVGIFLLAADPSAVFTEDGPLLSLLGFFGIPTLGILWYYFEHLRNNLIETFAHSNNWKLKTYNESDALPLGLKDTTGGLIVSKTVCMQIDGHEWDMFMMDTLHKQDQKFTIFRTKLRKERGDMLLNSHNTRGFLQVPQNWQVIKLEGNFSDFFTLHIPENTHIDVLSYMSPDLMELLMVNNKTRDLEISSQHLFVICDYDIRDEKNIKAVLPVLGAIYNKVM